MFKKEKLLSDIDLGNIRIDIDDDQLFITIAKYKLFMSYGKTGMDAFMLYMHLQFTAKLQSTNSVKAKDIYIRQGLKWGSDKLTKAKRLLYDLGLIEKIQRHDEGGKFKESYIKVKTRTSPFEIEAIETPTATLVTATLENRSTVSDNKCLNEKVKCLNKKVNAPYSENQDFLSIYETWNNNNLTKHKLLTLIREIKKKHIEVIKHYGVEEITNCITNYSEVLENGEQQKYYFTHKYNLWEFLERGYKLFLKECTPLDKYKKRELTSFGKQQQPDKTITELYGERENE